MRLSSCPFQLTRTACALMVMPRSRSSSIESSTCSRISRAETAPVTSRMRSASVDLPWSMCAMIEKLRILLWSIDQTGYGLAFAVPVLEVGGAPEHVVLPAGPDADLVAVRVLRDPELVLRREDG